MLLVGLFGFVFFKVALDAYPYLKWNFFTDFPSRFPHKAGILSAAIGTLWIITLTILISLPIGIAVGIYVSEMMKPGWLKNFIEINIHNLSGVPSIIFGLLGLVVFVRFFHLDRSLWAGALTMALIILPFIITTVVDCLRRVPNEIRMAAYGLGASKIQVIWQHVLPHSLSGIMTTLLLSIARVIGESAPLIMIGALSFVAFVPTSPSDSFTVLAIQIFNWAGRPQVEFQGLAAAGIVVLLGFMAILHFFALFLKLKITKKV